MSVGSSLFTYLCIPHETKFAICLPQISFLISIFNNNNSSHTTTTTTTTTSTTAAATTTTTTTLCCCCCFCFYCCCYCNCLLFLERITWGCSQGYTLFQSCISRYLFHVVKITVLCIWCVCACVARVCTCMQVHMPVCV